MLAFCVESNVIYKTRFDRAALIFGNRFTTKHVFQTWQGSTAVCGAHHAWAPSVLSPILLYIASSRYCWPENNFTALPFGASKSKFSNYELRRSSDQRRKYQRYLCWRHHRSDLKVTPYVSSRLVRCQQGSWSSSRVSLAPRGGMSHQCHVFSGSLPTNVTPTSQVVDIQSSRQRITIHTFNTFTTISI